MRHRNILATAFAGLGIVAAVTACDPIHAPAPTTLPPAVVTQAAPVISAQERADREYFACSAPIFGLTFTYDEARDRVPAELASAIESGRALHRNYTELPAGLSVSDVADVAGLTEDEEASLQCAVDAFGGGAA